MDQQKEEALQPLTDEELSSEEMEQVAGGWHGDGQLI